MGVESPPKPNPKFIPELLLLAGGPPNPNPPPKSVPVAATRKMHTYIGYIGHVGMKQLIGIWHLINNVNIVKV